MAIPGKRTLTEDIAPVRAISPLRPGAAPTSQPARPIGTGAHDDLQRPTLSAIFGRHLAWRPGADHDAAQDAVVPVTQGGTVSRAFQEHDVRASAESSESAANLGAAEQQVDQALIADPAVGASPALSLPAAARLQLEAATGIGLEDVTVHEQARLADEGFRALTHGTTIYLAPGEYAPTTPAGLQLLAHELVHVAQTVGEATRHGGQVQVANDGAAEAQAEHLSKSISAAGEPPAPWTPVRASGDAHATRVDGEPPKLRGKTRAQSGELRLVQDKAPRTSKAANNQGDKQPRKSVKQAAEDRWNDLPELVYEDSRPFVWSGGMDVEYMRLTTSDSGQGPEDTPSTIPDRGQGPSTPVPGIVITKITGSGKVRKRKKVTLGRGGGYAETVKLSSLTAESRSDRVGTELKFVWTVEGEVVRSPEISIQRVPKRPRPNKGKLKKQDEEEEEELSSAAPRGTKRSQPEPGGEPERSPVIGKNSSAPSKRPRPNKGKLKKQDEEEEDEEDEFPSAAPCRAKRLQPEHNKEPQPSPVTGGSSLPPSKRLRPNKEKRKQQEEEGEETEKAGGEDLPKRPPGVSVDKDARLVTFHDMEEFQDLNKALGREHRGDSGGQRSDPGKSSSKEDDGFQILPWQGSKKSIRHFVIHELLDAAENQTRMTGIPVDRIVEPFMGAATVFLNWPQNRLPIAQHIMGDINESSVKLLAILKEGDQEELEKTYKTIHKNYKQNTKHGHASVFNGFIEKLNKQTANKVPSEPLQEGDDENRLSAESASAMSDIMEFFYFSENTRGGIHLAPEKTPKGSKGRKKAPEGTKGPRRWQGTRVGEKVLKGRTERFHDRITRFKQRTERTKATFHHWTWQRTIELASQAPRRGRDRGEHSEPSDAGIGEVGTSGGVDASDTNIATRTIVYCDPPYPKDWDTDDLEYGEAFTMGNLRQLLISAKTLAESGITVVVSNYDHSSDEKLFKGNSDRSDTPGDNDRPGVETDEGPDEASRPPRPLQDGPVKVFEDLRPTMTFVFPVVHNGKETMEMLLVYAPLASPMNTDQERREGHIEELKQLLCSAPPKRPRGRPRGSTKVQARGQKQRPDGGPPQKRGRPPQRAQSGKGAGRSLPSRRRPRPGGPEQGAEGSETVTPLGLDETGRSEARPRRSGGVGDCLHRVVHKKLGDSACDVSDLRELATTWCLDGGKDYLEKAGLGEAYIGGLIDVLSTPGKWFGEEENGNMAPKVLASIVQRTLIIVSVFKKDKRVYEVSPFDGNSISELTVFFDQNHYTEDPVAGVHDGHEAWQRIQT